MPLIMPCYNDWEYKANGNQDDGGYDVHNQYSDHAKSIYSKHTPSEPDHHDYEYNSDPTDYNNYANCKDYANDMNWKVDETQPQ
jgi:hypothetical protein